MLAAMLSRAPDGDQFFHADRIGFGQAFLRTGASGPEGMNRLTLDGQVWVVADARIDGRAELLRKLRAAGRTVADDAPHAELLLNAYAVFGDQLVNHLIGDFAFALWDAPRQRLLCVRDHFGVRPFFHARVGGRFYFASDIEALLTIEGLSRTLDERAMAEFLLLGVILEPQRTIYRDIHCLPPATALVLCGEATQSRTWWTLERGPEVRYARRDDYVAAFQDVFRQAVLDRVPAAALAVQLSGGLDSTSIAAMAVAGAARSGLPVRAYHQTSASLIPEDVERTYAQQVADRLGIPMVTQDLGEIELFAGSLEPARRTSQPFNMPLLSAHAHALGLMQESGERVVFSGYMGDAALSTQPTYYTDWLRQGRPVKFAREVAHHWHLGRSVRGLGLRTLSRRVAPVPEWKPGLPDWIDPQWVKAHDLETAWQTAWHAHENTNDGLAQFRLPWISLQFSATEALATPVVGRFPFFDLRLLRFLSGVPNVLLADKRILREAMRPFLPASVLERPKQGAPGDLLRQLVTNGKIAENAWVPALPPGVLPERFHLAWRRYLDGAGGDSTWTSWLLMQSLSLGHWLVNNATATRDNRDGTHTPASGLERG